MSIIIPVLALPDLLDVADAPAPTDGQVLTYASSLGAWAPPPPPRRGGGGGGGGVEGGGAGGGGGVWPPAAAAVGFDDANQSESFRLWMSVIDAAGEVWMIHRANEEGWGVAFGRVVGTNRVTQARPHTVLSVRITSV